MIPIERIPQRNLQRLLHLTAEEECTSSNKKENPESNCLLNRYVDDDHEEETSRSFSLISTDRTILMELVERPYFSNETLKCFLDICAEKGWLETVLITKLKSVNCDDSDVDDDDQEDDEDFMSKEEEEEEEEEYSSSFG